ncbi:MAG: DUF5671 domain-containing protein [Candidatus Yanofskybacteria bacterium]|nr:DUF5671 domain-containing protein [Candidatus Yanofskybacteria bacterium]
MDTPNKSLPRDVFLYLLAIVALGMAAVNFGTLLFQFVNIYVPDVVSDRYTYRPGYYGTIRWAVSSLIVVFPVYLWVSRFLRRDIDSSPEKKELKIRKWLLYFTLFIAGVVIIGDLVALIYNYLQGELTMRFFLKVVSILFIAGSIFYYYLNELRDRSHKMLKTFAYVVIAAVTGATVWGFVLAGSPGSQREVRLDEQRVQDLQSIQWQIVNYWQSKESLPANLSDLRDSLSGYVPPVDPVTQQAYEYGILGDLSFRLCANFDTASQDGSAKDGSYAYPRPIGPEGIQNDNWLHDPGRTCFERTIDPDLFPPRKQ